MDEKLKNKLSQMIMAYSIQDLEDEEQNKHFCICDRRLIIDYINTLDFVEELIRKPFMKMEQDKQCLKKDQIEKLKS